MMELAWNGTIQWVSLWAICHMYLQSFVPILYACMMWLFFLQLLQILLHTFDLSYSPVQQVSPDLYFLRYIN